MLAYRIASALILVAAMLSATPASAADSRGARQLTPAGACTRFFVQWSYGYDNDEAVVRCSALFGIDKFCDEHDSRVVIGYIAAPGTWQGQRRVLKCTPKHHDDSIGEQFIKIVEGIGEGLIAAAPFVAEGVLGLTCIYGQIYACVVLAVQISDQAGLKIPTEVGDAIRIANKAPLCIKGDVVACAYLGAYGAKTVGLEIPGAQVFEDSRRCSDGEFAACVRLGKAAADAGGIDTGSLTEAIIDGEACLDGNKDACWKLAKEAVQDHLPLKGVPGAAEDAAACERGDRKACERLGKNLYATALGLTAPPDAAPFGANDCVSATGTKGPVGLASAWDDRDATSIAVFASDGARFAAPYQASTRNGGWAATAKWAAADFTGDGATDMLAIWDDADNNTLTLRQATERGFTVAHWAIKAGTWVDTTVWLPGDFNGDGRMDVAAAWDDGGQTSIAVYVSDGTRFAAPRQWNVRDGGWGDGVKWAVGDFTGDGKADIVAIWDNGGTNTITVRQSTGSGFAPVHWASNAGGWNDASVWLAGDYNGDGRLDLAAAWHDGDAVSIAVYLSSGSRITSWNQWSQRDGGWIGDAKWAAGDFNGDGKTDVAAVWNDGGSNTLTVRQSTGSGFVPVHWASKSGGWSPTAAWCSGQFSAPQNFAERAKDHTAISDALKAAQAAGVSRTATSDRITDSVAARAAPSPDLRALATKGAALAAQDPILTELRNQQTDDAARRGFDIGMGASEGQTFWGPGKQKILESLAPSEQLGYAIAAYFNVDRNRHVQRATVGHAIAVADPVLAQARAAEADGRYGLGFDIATAIFGDPKLGAEGNTGTGPGSLATRDTLSPPARRGFDAAVKIHLSRHY